MGKRKDKSTGEIQRLLDERRRVEQWLERLRMAADKTPPLVRDRVRGDYEARLEKVVTDLQGYAEDIRSALADQHSRRKGLKEQERAATEELAEAELRHAVGEFGEGEWREKKGAILEQLISIRETLGDAEEEIAELDEVLAALESRSGTTIPELDDEELEIPVPPPSKPAPAPSRARPAAPAPSDRHSLGSELGLRDIGKKEPEPAPGPRAAAKAGSQTEAFGDELAFLKAVTDDRKPPAEPRRAGGGTKAAAEIEKLSEHQTVSKSRPSVINQRTLKCGECGAMNLPTEWYCDRCGAELAAL